MADTHEQPMTDDLEALAAKEESRVVELSRDGRMRAPHPEARALLRDRLRKAEVLPTGRGWAVLRALGPSAVDHDEHPDREVVAAGTIDERGLSLIDFIGFLASSYETGVLTASCGELERSVYLHRGDVVWASSTSMEDRLGALLVARGRITSEQLELVMHEGGGKRLGRLCVEHGFLSAHELWTMVQEQLTEIFDRLLATETGVWSFARVSEEALADSQIHLSTQGLLVDALRRLDELKVYRQRVRSADVLVQRVEGKDDISKLPKPERESGEAVLALLGSSTTIRTLMRLTGRGEFGVTRIVYHLVRAGLVEVVDDETGPIPRRTSMITQAANEVADIYALAFKEMVDGVARVQRAPALIKVTRDFLGDESSGQYASFYRSVRIAPDGAVDMPQLLKGAATAGLDVQQLSDALSELMFFMLFSATEILGRRRGDDLARRVKMIHGMLTSTVTETL